MNTEISPPPLQALNRTIGYQDNSFFIVYQKLGKPWDAIRTQGEPWLIS